MRRRARGIGEAGFSLLEVIVVAGVAGVILLGMTTLQQRQVVAMKRETVQIDLRRLVSEVIEQVLVNPQAYATWMGQVGGVDLPATYFACFTDEGVPLPNAFTGRQGFGARFVDAATVDSPDRQGCGLEAGVEVRLATANAGGASHVLHVIVLPDSAVLVRKVPATPSHLRVPLDVTG